MTSHSTHTVGKVFDSSLEMQTRLRAYESHCSLLEGCFNQSGSPKENLPVLACLPKQSAHLDGS